MRTIFTVREWVVTRESTDSIEVFINRIGHPESRFMYHCNTKKNSSIRN